ncbi:MAG: hypothetical protein NT067_03385 [Candidatus Diapherotrites archaeon]|nr:hypothetical protein [Candidatus Diapherotrites archaeon]
MKCLRDGAVVHERAISLFSRNPEMPLKELWKEAIGGKAVTENQKRYLIGTIKKLRENYRASKIVCQMFRKRPAHDIFELIFGKEFADARPNAKIRDLGMDSFGIVISLDGGIMRDCVRADARSGDEEIISHTGAFTREVRYIHPSTGGFLFFSVRFLPANSLNRDEGTRNEKHEQSHTIDNAILDPHMQKFRPTRHHIFSIRRMRKRDALRWFQSELTAYFGSFKIAPDFSNMEGISAFLIDELDRTGVFSDNELSKLDDLPYFIHQASAAMPKRELIGILRTTNPLKVRHRITAVLEQIEEKSAGHKPG